MFDTKDGAIVWLNQELGSEPTDESISDLVSKLQLLAQNLNNGISKASDDLVSAVPRCVADIQKIRREAVALKTDLKNIMKDVVEVDSRTQKSVKFLSEIDVVKRRMEGCQETLSEVDNWNRRTQRVKQLMEDKDLVKSADELAAMSRSLGLLAAVPEFAGRTGELAGFRDELEAMAVPHLLECFGRREVDGEVMDVFRKIERNGSVKRHYFSSRLQAAQSLAETRAGPEVTEWLADFCDALRQFVHDEMRFAKQIFPADHEIVVKSLIGSILEELVPDLEKWMKAFVDRKGPDAVCAIVELFQICSHFVETLIREIKQAELDQNSNQIDQNSQKDDKEIEISGPILASFTSFHAAYAHHELRKLRRTLALLSVNSGDAAKGEQTMHKLALQVGQSTHVVVEESKLAIERCLQLSGGIQVSDLVTALDRFLVDFLQSVFALLGKDDNMKTVPKSPRRAMSAHTALKPKVEDEKKPEPTANDDLFGEESTAGKFEWMSELQGAFEMFATARTLKSELCALERAVHCQLAPSVRSLLEARTADGRGEAVSSMSPHPILHAALLASYSGKIRDLERFCVEEESLRSASEEGIGGGNMLLSAAGRAVETLHTRARARAYDLMTREVHRLTRGLGGREEWKAVRPPRALPEFSMQPSEYMTQIGHHLLALVQQLEPHDVSHSDDWETESSSDQKIDSLHWMSEVFNGSVAMLVSEIAKIRKLSSVGTKQLSADLEYLANLGEALGVAENRFLRNINLILLADPGSVDLANLGFETADERAAANQIAQIRGLDLNVKKK
eukprot:140174_1